MCLLTFLKPNSTYINMPWPTLKQELTLRKINVTYLTIKILLSSINFH